MNELKELAALTGKDINTWQDDVAVTEEETNTTDVQYASLIQKANEPNERKVPTGFLILSAVVLGSAGFMRWRGMI